MTERTPMAGILRETHLTPTIEEHGVCGGGRQKRTLSFHLASTRRRKSITVGNEIHDFVNLK